MKKTIAIVAGTRLEANHLEIATLAGKSLKDRRSRDTRLTAVTAGFIL